MPKQREALIAGCLLAAFVIGGCAAGLPPDIAKLGYVSRDPRFAMGVPPGWTVREQNGSPQVFLLGPEDPAGIRPNVNVLIEPVAARSLQEWVAANRKQLETLNGFKFVSEEDRDLAGGRAAHVTTFTHSLMGKAVVQRQLVALAGEKAFIVTATASPDTFEANEKDFEGVLKTLRVGW